jgi:hypothetical protein
MDRPNSFWSCGAKPNIPGRQAPQNGQRSSETPMSFPQCGQIIEPEVWRMTGQHTGAIVRPEA